MLEQIKSFLKTFSHILYDEHKEKLLRTQTHLEYINNLNVFENKNGQHFEDCVWSNENVICGPDTCNCFNYKRIQLEGEEEAKQIIKYYQSTYCENKPSNLSCINCVYK